MRNGILAALTVLPLLTAVLLYAQGGVRYVVLPPREARQVSELCRAGPKVDGAWQPSRVDTDTLESRLPLIAKLASTSGLVGIHIAQPERYYRQYLGIVVKDRKLIFVNAFLLDELPADWHERLVNYCDGGSTFWGVVYDPKTHQFSELSTDAALPAPPPPPTK
jgi:hypothetical protein